MLLSIVLVCLPAVLTAGPAEPAEPRQQLLQLVSLESHPLAQCNDGTPAVYYRRPMDSFQDTKKLLIYLEGGGHCVPLDPGVSSCFVASFNFHIDTVSNRWI